MKRLAGVLLALLALTTTASAQAPFRKVSPTVSLSVSAVSSNVAVGTAVQIANLWICNTGTTLAYLQTGDSTVTADTTGIPIPGGLCGNVSPDGRTNLAAITASGTTTLLISPGAGTLIGAGGGGGSGGGASSAGGGGYGFGTSFQSGGVFATLTAAASSASVALPAGNAVVIQNAGTTTVSCTLGIGSATATANEIIVPANSAVETPVGSNTFGACIDQTGSVSNLVVIVGGTDSIVNGTVALGQATKANSVPVTIASDQYTDPCAGGSVAKSSVAISVTSATTTSLVAASGTTTVYVCGYSFTIAPSATSADTALIERGTGAACVTTQAALTGTYGNGDLTSAAPATVVSVGNAGQTVVKSAGSDAICLVTAGTAVNVQGVLTYVQQ